MFVCQRKNSKVKIQFKSAKNIHTHINRKSTQNVSEIFCFVFNLSAKRRRVRLAKLENKLETTRRHPVAVPFRSIKLTAVTLCSHQQPHPVFQNGFESGSCLGFGHSGRPRLHGYATVGAESIATLLQIPFTGYAIKCYQCESVTSPKCGEKFEADANLLLDCSRIAPPRFLQIGPFNRNATGCMKKSIEGGKLQLQRDVINFKLLRIQLA